MVEKDTRCLKEVMMDKFKWEEKKHQILGWLLVLGLKIKVFVISFCQNESWIIDNCTIGSEIIKNLGLETLDVLV